MVNELWEQIPAYPNYQISNFGRAKRIARTVVRTDGTTINLRERISSGVKVNRTGTLAAYARNEHTKGRHNALALHCLVAAAFLPNPEHRKHVLFKDGNPYNCHVDNLMWGSTPKRKHEHKETGGPGTR